MGLNDKSGGMRIPFIAEEENPGHGRGGQPAGMVAAHGVGALFGGGAPKIKRGKGLIPQLFWNQRPSAVRRPLGKGGRGKGTLAQTVMPWIGL